MSEPAVGTTARVAERIFAILNEVARINNVIENAPTGVVQRADVLAFRRSLTRIYDEAERLRRWMQDAALEEPRN
jgi:hypothetical protein